MLELLILGDHKKMINLKFLSIFVGFWGFCLWVAVYSLYSESSGEKSFRKELKKGIQESYFKKINYYKVEEGIPYLSLDADTLNIKDQISMDFIAPKGSVYIDDDEIKFVSSVGSYNSQSRFLSLDEKVRVRSPRYDYKSSNLYIDGRNNIVSATGEVKALIKGTNSEDTLSLRSDGLRSYTDQGITNLYGGVAGKIIRKRRYEGHLDFSAASVSLNSVKSQLKLDKDVKIQRNNYNLSAGKAEILLENFNKKLKYYTLYDDVKLTELVELSSGKKQVRRAYAEKLEAFQAKGEVILTGAPRVEQGRDVIKGYQITLRENVELVEIDDSQTSFSLKRKDK